MKPQPQTRPSCTVHNHTAWSLDQIAHFPKLATTVNKWRGRTIALYGHPDDATLVISVGTSFDRTLCVVSVETQHSWATALAYAAHGKIYVSE